MYKVVVYDYFSSAHYLRDYYGKCENLHGHNYKVEVSLCSERLKKNGILEDFTIIKKVLKEITEYLDHKVLNDIEPFNKINPTSENIAKFIFDNIKEKFDNVCSVKVWENEKQYAEYIK